jgi:hypothetical protein
VIVGDVALAVRYEIAEDQAAYYLPTFIATALLVLVGGALLAEGLARRHERTRVAVLIAVSLGVAAVTSRNVRAHAGRSRDGRAPESAANVLASLPPRALAFTPEWNLYSPTLPVLDLEGKRGDVLILDVLLLRRGWYLDELARKHADRVGKVKEELAAYRHKLADWEEGRPYDGNELTALIDRFTQALMRSAWDDGAPVVWIGTVLSEYLPGGSALVPSGLGYRVLPSRQQAAAYVEDAALQLGVASRMDLPVEDVFTGKVRPLYVGMLVQRAIYEMSFGRNPSALGLCEVARRLDPHDPEAEEVEADLLAAENKVDEAIQLYSEAMRDGGDAARIAEKSRRALSAKR